MVKVDLEVQFKISVMKRKFENQKPKAQVSNVENKSNVCTNVFGFGLRWGKNVKHARGEG